MCLGEEEEEEVCLRERGRERGKDRERGCVFEEEEEEKVCMFGRKLTCVRGT